MHYRVPILLLSLASVLWIAGSSYCYVCEVRENCNSDNQDHVKLDESKKADKGMEISPFVIADGQDFNVQADGHLIYIHSTDSLIVQDDAVPALNAFADYLKAHPEKRVVVNGKFKNEEGGGDLGNSRAEAFISYFTNRYSLSPQRFNTTFSKDNGLYVDKENDWTYNALDFAFNVDKSKVNDEKDESKLLALKESLSNPRTVYFDFGSSLMKSNPDLHQYFSDLKFYTEEVEGAKVRLVGHTDNKGDLDRNKALSVARANDVKRYLMKNHSLNSNVFQISGKGELLPVASNDTDKGRAKNRRVEIQLVSK